MNTRQPHQLLTTFLTALGAVAASAVLGLNLAEQADQAAAQQQVEQRQLRELTTQVHKLPTVLIEGRRQA
jgi:hypothetical protein